MATEISTTAKEDVNHVETLRKVDTMSSEQVKGWDNLAEDARLATEDEHSTTFIEAVKRYPKACAWSMAVTLCIIMDGYDGALLGSLFAFPAFQQKFGHEIGDTGKYTVEAHWQVALGVASSVGNVFGVYFNGWLTERFGHKPILLGGLFSLTGIIFIQFFAQNVQTLFAGQILCGIPWGMFSTMAPSYASEVVPLVLRSYLETWVVACWGIGQFFSYAVLFSLNHRLDDWAWRIPFAVQWVWPVLIFPIVLFCPESPWWLVRKGRLEKAERSVKRLISAKNNDLAREQAKRTVALMIETNQLEKDVSRGTKYISCFQGTNLWRTEIGALAWGIQITSGFVIQGWATYFFEQAGLSASDAFKMTLGIGGIHLVCNLGSAALSGNFGRRTLFLNGLAVLAMLMFVIGALAVPHQTKGLGFAESSVYLVWFAVWCLTIGPLPYIINGEVSSTRLRSKTFAIARATYVVMSISGNVAGPYILNPDEANWKGKTGFLTGGLTVLSWVWGYFRLPETRGRTFEELDVLFAEKHIGAKTFGKAVITREGELIRVTGPHLRQEEPEISQN